MWQPLRDLVMVKRLAGERQIGSIVLANPESQGESTKGVVVAVGPGAVSPGYWRKAGGSWVPDANGIHHKVGGEWEWVEPKPLPGSVKVGQVVMFGPWSDLLKFNEENSDTLTDEIAIVPEEECRWIE